MVVQESSKALQADNWKNTIGRVAFMNCDPLFLMLPKNWSILSAPPSWLTGHLLRRDCIIAPIPAADYAKNAEDLVLIPDLGICSRGEVGSVLIFGNVELKEMNTIALPSDSSSSVALLKFILQKRGLNPNLVTMGPEISTMLSECDGALLIGDRALDASRDYPHSVVMDLGDEWQKLTGKPMVFGVFAARKDTPISNVRLAHNSLVMQLEEFENSPDRRLEIIREATSKSGLSSTRLNKYFGEVFNRLDKSHIEGLDIFLVEVCGKTSPSEFMW